jgi:hypothetical protein
VLDIRDNLRDDERRQREEARLNALQEQIDELRCSCARAQPPGQVEEAQAALGEQIAGLGRADRGGAHEARGYNDLRWSR